MAGDWIKMRVNLVTHPKVMAIAEFLADESEYQEWSTLTGFVPSYGGSNERALRNERHAALRVTRYVTVCALLRFWGYANEHARDEFVAFMTIEDIDEVVQVPSFGLALQSVGWIECSEEPTGIRLPNFAEFNAVADERQYSTKASERQRRYRERLKASQCDANDDVTRDVTRDEVGDVTVTSRNAPREEKRREEKKETKTPWAAPDWVPAEAWKDFEQMRVKRKKPLTDRARTLAVNELAKLRDAGNDVAKVIEQTVLHSWDTFYPIKSANGNGGALNGNDARYVN